MQRFLLNTPSYPLDLELGAQETDGVVAQFAGHMSTKVWFRFAHFARVKSGHRNLQTSA